MGAIGEIFGEYAETIATISHPLLDTNATSANPIEVAIIVALTGLMAELIDWAAEEIAWADIGPGLTPGLGGEGADPNRGIVLGGHAG